MTLKELKVRAAELKIVGRSTMNKDELVSMIADVEGRNVPPTTEYQFAVEVPTTSKLTEEGARDALNRVLAISMDPDGLRLLNDALDAPPSPSSQDKRSKRSKANHRRRQRRITKRGY